MSKKQEFDVIVIGGGPGGYVAAIKATHSGASVALIEKGKMGGTCLNVGCIPTKALIANAELLHKIQRAEEFGISVKGVSFDFSKMKLRKDDVVDRVRSGLEGLIKQNKIAVFRGHGSFISPYEVKVVGEDPAVLTGKRIIIATGSEPRDIQAFPFDYEKVHSSTSILDLTQLPKKLAIIGGGVIGCEAASLYHILGVEVVILEMLPSIISLEGEKISQTLRSAFEKRGITVKTGVKVTGIVRKGKGVKVELEGETSVAADMALVAVGRVLNTFDLGLDRAGVLSTPEGVIPVNDRMETNVANIYAIGDVTAKWWLAHWASHQGIVAAQNATGTPAELHENAVPSVIFTLPEIASVGMTLEKAKKAGYRAVLGQFPFQALGKAQATHDTDGFTQVVIDQNTGQILGAQVVGHEAASLIAEMALAIANELTVECVADTIHAHPTIAEAWMEAALVANETPIHLPPRRRS